MIAFVLPHSPCLETGSLPEPGPGHPYGCHHPEEERLLGHWTRPEATGAIATKWDSKSPGQWGGGVVVAGDPHQTEGEEESQVLGAGPSPPVAGGSALFLGIAASGELARS